ncbi:ferrochelatase [Telmatocola sphagniphila]|uniref:Ferrochelatase n=1 Tax=Telmatocola sphagniphila TaxID=1123043 RepID=A0A8E6B3H7_9BACT|nr:ferrochelatase [Telmatocola sphagniphila]QVL29868.1 ferrochelatase [Telmatocola sphagniphila]
MTGILLIQLGTPDEPTAPALRRYLRQFLGDPRVIEVNRILWWFILRIILLIRPARSAAKYRRVWDAKTGSPLRYFSLRQVELLQKKFPNCIVRCGMQIGNPAVAEVVEEMIAQGVERLIVMPMYPQYSATTTASATDVLFKHLMNIRHVPAIRIVPPYYAHPAYIDALVSIIHEEEGKLSWKPDHYLLSFHGIPQRYAKSGDPYATHVTRTTQALVKKLNLTRDKWTQTYQSLFGREEWLRPYTDDTLEKLAKKGVKKILAILPGFTVDCLETIDEIGLESKEVFEHAGGEHLRACPCLNDHAVWISAMETIIREEGQGWL